MSTPQYKVTDVIYLRDSAMMGRLEAYRVDNMKYDSQMNCWLYEAIIHMGGPETDTIIDNYNLKHVTSLWFREPDLITVCDAVTMAIETLRSQLNKLTIRRNLIGHRETPENPQSLLESGQPVYIRESAAIGFIERVYITNITYDNMAKSWLYQITRPGMNEIFQRDIWYRRDELIDDLTAVDLSINYTKSELSRLESLLDTVCR